MSDHQPESAQPTVVTIGNFDGVHVGHAALIAAALRVLGRVPGNEGAVVALCFDPNPLTILRPQSVPPQLTTFDHRRELLLQLGATAVEPLRPTMEFLAQRPEAFIDWLVERYRPAAIVEGPDFRFGSRRTGSIDTLRRHGHLLGFETIVVQPVEVSLTDRMLVRASSSIVRWLLASGRVRDARLVLGRPYELRATVVRGDQRGRSIGIPTANLDQGHALLPADGIYAGLASCPDGATRPAAISIGNKPTFQGSQRVCEAHILDYDGPVDEYGWIIRLQFLDWVRDQLVFSEVNPLVEQIHRDIEVTRRFHRSDTFQPGCRVESGPAGREVC